MPKERIQKISKLPRRRSRRGPAGGNTAAGSQIENLQHRLGNRAVQRMIVQRSGVGPAELDDETAARINRERSGGQELDGGVQTGLGESMGQDFSGVRVHTSREADDLNHQLGARAFTTGQDIFFREGEYDPSSAGGKELLAHELTHVVQQNSGAVGGADRMTVNQPGDAFEQQAEATAKTASAANAAPAGAVQRQPEEETVQAAQAEEEEEQVQMAEAEEEEEETVQKAEAGEEEEELSA